MDMQEIREEIERLENAETNYQNIMKLSALYAVDAHYRPMARYSNSSSEFLLAVSQAPVEQALEIIDEHMEVLKAVYPAEYLALVKRIKEKALG